MLSAKFEEVYDVVGAVPPTFPTTLPANETIRHLFAKRKDNNKQVLVRRLYFENNLEAANEIYVFLYNLRRTCDHISVIPIEDIFVDHQLSEISSNAHVKSFINVVTPRFDETLADYLLKLHENNLEASLEEKKLAKITGVEEERVMEKQQRQRSWSVSASKNTFKATDGALIKLDAMIKLMLDLTSAVDFLHQKGFIFQAGYLSPISIYCSDFYSKLNIDIVNSAIAYCCSNACKMKDFGSVTAEIAAITSPEIRLQHKPLALPTLTDTKQRISLTAIAHSQKNDIWSLGVMFFQILTVMDESTILFMFSNPARIQDHIQQELSSNTYHPRLVKYIKKMLTTEPQSRYSASKLLSKLVKLQKEQAKKMEGSSKRLTFSTLLAPAELGSLLGIDSKPSPTTVPSPEEMRELRESEKYKKEAMEWKEKYLEMEKRVKELEQQLQTLQTAPTQE